MLEELEYDLEKEKIFFSPRLIIDKKVEYLEILRASLEKGNPESFAKAIRESGMLKRIETRTHKSGKVTQARVPINAPNTLAEGEFNRYYITGLCQSAMQKGIPELIVYRAKEVRSARSVSIQMIGKSVDPKAVLSDLRENVGFETHLQLPPGPNSGLSVKLP